MPAVAAAMPNSRGGRPVRLAKQVQPAPGFVDSSTLLFDSEDEVTEGEGEGEHDNAGEGNCEGNCDDHRTAKKPRLRGKFKAQMKDESPPPPDSSCLAYYPDTYEAVQLWNKLLHLPPPLPMSDASNKVPERSVDVPEPDAVNCLPSQAVSNKNEFYDETKVGFGNLPGEIRSRWFTYGRLPQVVYYYTFCHT